MQPQYDVLVVDDDEMPTSQDWLIIKHCEGLLAVLRRSAASDPCVLADAWAAARRYQQWRPPLTRAG